MLSTTSYDELWTSVRDNYKGNPSDIPQSEESIYRCIANGINTYNQKARKYEKRLSIVSYDEALEEITPSMTNDELLILTYIICSLIARDALLQFSSLYAVFAKELSVSNTKGQSDALRQNLVYFEMKAQSLIEDLVDTFQL